MAGVVHSPPTEEYAATLGGGSTRNGVPLGCGTVPLTSAGAHRLQLRDRGPSQPGTAVAALLPQVRDIRRPGSCALDLCAVAAGEADGYVEEGPTSGTTPPAA